MTYSSSPRLKELHGLTQLCRAGFYMLHGPEASMTSREAPLCPRASFPFLLAMMYAHLDDRLSLVRMEAP